MVYNTSTEKTMNVVVLLSFKSKLRFCFRCLHGPRLDVPRRIDVVHRNFEAAAEKKDQERRGRNRKWGNRVHRFIQKLSYCQIKSIGKLSAKKQLKRHLISAGSNSKVQDVSK